MTDEQLQKILAKLDIFEKRLSAIEDAVFKSPKGRDHQEGKKKEYTGPTGGVRVLLDHQFFKSKHTLADVRLELNKHGYYYSRQAIHESLKTLSKMNGPLVSLNEGKGKIYIERK